MLNSVLLNFDPQENKNLILCAPAVSWTAVFEKAYAEIEEYIMTKKTPTPQGKPGDVITKITKNYPRKEKKNNVQVLIIKVP